MYSGTIGEVASFGVDLCVALPRPMLRYISLSEGVFLCREGCCGWDGNWSDDSGGYYP